MATKDEQISKHFKMSEFNCHDGTPVPEKYKANVRKLVLTVLEPLRDYLKVPVYVNSGYRTPAYNKKCGGVKHSYHMKAMAADIAVRTISPKDLADFLKDEIRIGTRLGKAIGGLGRYPGFTHVDIGPARRWGSN